MVTRAWKVHGLWEHRQAMSFESSHEYNFRPHDSEGSSSVRKVAVINSDLTGTNYYSIVVVTCDTDDLCKREFDGQISDGLFENYRTGLEEEVPVDSIQSFLDTLHHKQK